MDIQDWGYVYNEVDSLYRIVNEEFCKTFIKGPRGSWKWRNPSARTPWVTTVQIVDTLVKCVQERWASDLLPALHEHRIGPMDDNAAAYCTALAITDILNLSQEDGFGRWHVLDWSSVRNAIEGTTKLIVDTLKSTPEANKEVE